MKAPIAQVLSQKGPAVVTVAPTTLVAEAVQVMNDHRIGSVVVLQDQQIVGMFTERDILTRIVAAGQDPRGTAVRDVMTRDVLTIAPETTVEQVMELFTTRRCRHLPVVDGGRMIGLISIGDISRWLVEAHRAEAEHLRAYISGDLVH